MPDGPLRISNYADLLGTGGLHASARWHTAGRRVVYLAENPSSALLEVLVHLETDEDHRPGTYQILKVEAEDGLGHDAIELSTLSSAWKSNELETQALGDAWLLQGSTALFRAPSAITPETWNWVLNPSHADAARLQVVHREAAVRHQTFEVMSLPHRRVFDKLQQVSPLRYALVEMTRLERRLQVETSTPT